MTEHCQDHHALSQTVGEMNGKIDLILSGQNDIKKDVSELYSKYNENHTSSEVQKTRIAPVFWALLVVGAVLLTGLVERFILK